MPNYIEEKVEEFGDNDFTVIIKDGVQYMQYETAKEYLKASLTDLLLKCKEAVGEERNIEAHGFESPEKALEWSKPDDIADYSHDLGYNSCRSTTLQNLDNLEK
jgi:hypothetical protein